jgi:hypothetical protein
MGRNDFPCCRGAASRINSHIPDDLDQASPTKHRAKSGTSVDSRLPLKIPHWLKATAFVSFQPQQN